MAMLSCVWNFNSIKVRLELETRTSVEELNNYFNSIKVRLEHTQGRFDALVNLFQFHKGTIRTVRTDTIRVPVADFNSIKVRLEPLCFIFFHAIHLNFNSIKVRLEPKN